jgi:cytochrome b subunit of formate dehydrogenase
MKEIQRFSKVQSWAHAVLGLSIILLILTGLPITFSEQLSWLMAILGGPTVTMLLHRLAAWALIFTAIFFGAHFILTRIFLREGESVLLTLQDIRDAILDMKYALGLTKETPKIGKYDWIRKMNMAGVTLFVILMIATGLVLWFPLEFASSISLTTIIAIRTVHAGVAIVFLLFLLAHTTSIHLRPDKFPMDMSIFTGYIPLDDARREFPLWAEKMEKNAMNGGSEIENNSYSPYRKAWVGAVALAFLSLVFTSLKLKAEGLAGLRLDGVGIWATVGLSIALGLTILYFGAMIYGQVRGKSQARKKLV